MSSTEESSSEEIDFSKFRKVYESVEHWNLRKVSKICLFTFFLQILAKIQHVKLHLCEIDVKLSKKRDS